MTLERKATLSPTDIHLRIKDNQISIRYKINDDFSGVGIGDTWVVFNPSKELMEALKKEIDNAIKARK